MRWRGAARWRGVVSGIEGRASAYVCQAGACRLPVTEVAAFERELDAIGLAPLPIPPPSG